MCEGKMVRYKQSLFKTPTIKQVLLPGHLVANILTHALPNPVPSPPLVLASIIFKNCSFEASLNVFI